MLLIISLAVVNFTKQDPISTDLIAYEVNLNGISPEYAEDHSIICDMLLSAGLGDASVDVLGCEQTCEVLIFDLKNKEEAELVVNIFHAIEKEKISSDINKVKPIDDQLL